MLQQSSAAIGITVLILQQSCVVVCITALLAKHYEPDNTKVATTIDNMHRDIGPA